MSLRTKVAVLAAAMIGLAGVGAASPASAATACPTGAFAFASTLSNGNFKIGKNAASTDAKVTACGQITGDGKGGLLSVVAKDNISFAPTKTRVLGFDLGTTVTPTSDLTGPAVLSANGIDVALSGSVLVTTDVAGGKCSFPLTLNLTTGTSGTLKGSPLVADAATGLQTGKLVAGDFTVPKFSSSKTCNFIIAELSNGLLGLPLKSGASSITFDISLKLGV